MEDRNPTTVLVIDPDPAVSASLKTVLSLAGYVTLTAKAVDEALRLGVAHSTDLLIVDSHLDCEGEGEGAVNRLNSSFRSPIIATSTDARHQAPMLAAGARCFIRKPVDMQTLFATMESLLREANKSDAAGEAAGQFGLALP